MLMGTSTKLKANNHHLKVDMGGVELIQSDKKSELLLGIQIQEDLKWSEQIAFVANRLQSRLAALEKLKHVFRRKTRVTIVEGVFNSVLCYCLPLFGGCTQSQIDTLQVLQNRAARLSLGCPPRSNRDWMFSELQWMTVLQLVAYHTLVTVFRIRSHRQPEYLASKLCRDSRQGRILAENSCLEIYRKSFVFRA